MALLAREDIAGTHGTEAVALAGQLQQHVFWETGRFPDRTHPAQGNQRRTFGQRCLDQTLTAQQLQAIGGDDGIARGDRGKTL